MSEQFPDVALSCTFVLNDSKNVYHVLKILFQRLFITSDVRAYILAVAISDFWQWNPSGDIDSGTVETLDPENVGVLDEILALCVIVFEISMSHSIPLTFK